MESWNKHILSDTIKMSVEKALQDEARAHHFEEQMEKFAARMDAFDKRMQSMSYAFSNSYTIDCVEVYINGNYMDNFTDLDSLNDYIDSILE